MIEVVQGHITDQDVDAIVTWGGSGEPGKAVADPAAGRHVIHTVGEHGNDVVLTSCYVESLLLAEDLGVRSMAIAIEAHGFPIGRAAEIAAMAVRSLPIIRVIRLVTADAEMYDALTAEVAKPIVERCPTCGADAVPFVIGLPVPALQAAGDAGLVRLGGCISHGEGADPAWACTKDSTHYWNNGEKDERRQHAATMEAVAAFE